MKASANGTLFKANKSFSNLAATSISCVEKQETYTRRDSFDIGQVAGGAVNKVFGQIQEAISRVLNKNNMDMESATFDDLIKTITEDQCLWNEYRAEVRKNNIITNLACKEYLFVFIEENKERIEEQYIILKSVKNNSAGLNSTKNKSNYFDNTKSFRNMFLRSCKDEIVYADESPKHKPNDNSMNRRRRRSIVKQ